MHKKKSFNKNICYKNVYNNNLSFLNYVTITICFFFVVSLNCLKIFKCEYYRNQ